MLWHWTRRSATCVLSLALLGRAAAAQTTDVAPEPAYGTWVVAPFFGAARHSPVGTRWGSTPDRDHFVLGVHFTAPVLRFGPAALSYAPNVVPLIILTNNPHYGVTTGPDGADVVVEVGRRPVLGAGVAPAGLQLTLRVASRAEVYGATAAGALWFLDEVPIRGSRRVNYTVEWGGGIVLRVRPQRVVQLGYKFHHLSNMNTAAANPGVDADLFYAGLQWTVRLP